MSNSTLFCVTCGEKPRKKWRTVCASCANAERRESRRAKSVSRACVECGQGIPYERYRALTCSKQCSYRRKRSVAGIGSYTPHHAPCEMCGTQFWKTQGNHKYCSKRCLVDKRRHERNSNPDIARAHRERGKRWADRNRDLVRQQSAAWREANRDLHNEMSRDWARRNKYRQVPSWRSKNPELHAAKERKRQARLRAATPYLILSEVVEARLAVFGGTCWICGGEADTVDHVKPIAAGGINIPANMRPACRSCNSSKRDRWYGVARLDELVAEVLSRRV